QQLEKAPEPLWPEEITPPIFEDLHYLGMLHAELFEEDVHIQAALSVQNVDLEKHESAYLHIFPLLLVIWHGIGGLPRTFGPTLQIDAEQFVHLLVIHLVFLRHSANHGPQVGFADHAGDGDLLPLQSLHLAPRLRGVGLGEVGGR
ncbi:hypothetical protein EGW08_009624, partial [Elysia chlorotica]